MNFHSQPNTFVSHVHLKVQDLERSLSFYEKIIGFKVLRKSEKKAVLTADGKTPLVTIEQPEHVVPKETRTTGLYHFALLLPSRTELSKVLRYFIQIGLPLQGGSDHLVSEALYLADVDGNGIEIYADRPSSEWKWQHDQVVMTTEPLDAEGLLSQGQGEEWTGLPNETIMGHIHLHVSDLHNSEEFYVKGLGFDVVTRYGNQALFVSTGRYHHHIGLNTWNGPGAPTPSKNSAGLKSFSLVYPNEEVLNQVVTRLEKMGAAVRKIGKTFFTEDPSGNQIEFSI